MDVELSLRDYFSLFLRRWWIVALAFIVCLVGALLYTARQTPLYRSSANILINQGSAAEFFDPITGGTNSSFRLAENEARLLTSGLVSEVAIEELGYAAFVSAQTDDRADILTVSAVSVDPAIAQEVAQTYAEAYIQVRQDRFRNQRLSTASKLIEQLAILDDQIELATGDEKIRLQLQRRDLAGSSDLLNLAVQVADDTGAQIIDKAFRPGSPFTPRVQRNVMAGALLGLLAGAGIALLLDALDNSVKNREILESLTPGAPNLAVIPSLGRAPSRGETLVALNAPSGTAAESFRTLRAALQYVAVDQSIRVLQISSAHSAAGKTTVAANLAVTLAASGQSVAIVDADLRRPRVHQLFGVPQVPGLTSAIIGAAALEDCIHPVPGATGPAPLVLPSGAIPPGPAELLGSGASARAFAEISELVDVVIIDTPPVLAIADTMILSRYVDASILVVDAKKTNRNDVRLAYDRLVQSGAPVVGTVLNRAALGGATGYGYGYRADGGGGSKWFGRNESTDGIEVLTQSQIPEIEMAHAGAQSSNGAKPTRVGVSGAARTMSTSAATTDSQPPTPTEAPAAKVVERRPQAKRVTTESSTDGWADQIVLKQRDAG